MQLPTRAAAHPRFLGCAAAFCLFSKIQFEKVYFFKLYFFSVFTSYIGLFSMKIIGFTKIFVRASGCLKKYTFSNHALAVKGVAMLRLTMTPGDYFTINDNIVVQLHRLEGERSLVAVEAP